MRDLRGKLDVNAIRDAILCRSLTYKVLVNHAEQKENPVNTFQIDNTDHSWSWCLQQPKHWELKTNSKHDEYPVYNVNNDKLLFSKIGTNVKYQIF